MAATGETITYGELDARANRLAHLLRATGLQRTDHFAIFMENNSRYVEACSAGERSGLYYTCVNSYLTAEEVAYIIQNSESKVLITSRAKRDVAIAAAAQCPNLRLCLVVDGSGEDAPLPSCENPPTFPSSKIDLKKSKCSFVPYFPYKLAMLTSMVWPFSFSNFLALSIAAATSDFATPFSALPNTLYERSFSNAKLSAFCV
ncbi:MAG: AMP-binding protein [Pseudomonadales bacterium]